ncbi:hypothetical protein EGW08_017123 [Elysia chlorotica]|uniref:Calpain catalytic domain-containing protein n=1 Tax=Elysia chlorotica TaxID=188477 RepID=A0A433T0N7_ELYCH|nr:hypothetical protein EGW08_017123 [Elysia chlorotica]
MQTLKMPVEFRKQSYSKIKKSLLAKGQVFEDPEFPATSKSLYYSKVCNDIEWMRPRSLYLLEFSSLPFPLHHWLSRCIYRKIFSTLLPSPPLLESVIPDAKSQEFGDKNPYAGIFRFNFWRFGQTVEVVVDDRLPTRNGKLVFIHSAKKNEFWSCLLEKAYAKLFGDYETLATGHTSDALVDFTGWLGLYPVLVSKLLKLVIPVANLFTSSSFMSGFQGSTIGSKGPHGLLIGQGYNITMVKTIEVKKSFQATIGAQSLQLLRMYNPWIGNEYTGPWSDKSKEWKSVAVHEWAKMGVKFEKEGEFWISFQEWIKYFTDVNVCHFVNTSYFTLKKSWTETIWFSEWSSAGRNGGNDWNSLFFLSNPQYLFDITTEEPDQVMVSLEQRDVTEGRVAVGEKKNTIGFYIMKVEANRKYRIHVKGEQIYKSQFLTSRNVFGSCNLPKGRYVIIPCCASTKDTGQFMLRLYTFNKPSGK